MFSTLSKQQEKLLHTSPLFDGLTPEQIRPVLYCLQAKVRCAAPRQIIIHPQERSSGLFIALSGAIELVHTDANGRKSTMNILYPGDCHCENIGLLDTLSAQVQVLALDEVTMIKLADFLDADRSALCRELGRMYTEKLIAVRDNRIRLTFGSEAALP